MTGGPDSGDRPGGGFVLPDGGSVQSSDGIRLRKFPYPYRAMLAISSDIDRTSIVRFRNIHRFLNTREETSMGVGLGLDVADSLWVFLHEQRADSSLLAGYERGQPRPWAEELTGYAHAGWIDTLHTYGNYSAGSGVPTFERRHAEMAIEELKQRALAFKVWVNHGSLTNTQNFSLGGAQLGDLPSSPAYHTDLLLEYGIRFASNHTRGKEPGVDTPLAPLQLRDGRRMWGFSRYNAVSGTAAEEAIDRHSDFFAQRPGLLRTTPDAAQTTMVWWPPLLDAQLPSTLLDELVARSSYCVAAQHLGDLGMSDEFDLATIATLRLLASYQDEGRILVARVSRLLEYALVSRHVRFETRGGAGQLYIDVTAVADPVFGTFVPKLDQVRGLTFYVDDPGSTHLLIGGVPIRNAELVRYPSDGTAASIGVRWFVPDTTDYVALHGPRAHSVRTANAEPEPWTDAAVDLVTALERLEESRNDGLPPGVEPAAFSAAVDRSATMYSRGLDHYAEILERIGFTGRGRTLDLGSGPGQMSIALARANEAVVGVDARPEYVEAARRMARWLGEHEVTFSTGRAEAAQLEPGFELVWCHSVLMYTNHEAALRNVARWLGEQGLFYCGYTTEGARLRQVIRGVAGRNAGLVEQGLEILLANERWRAGLGQGTRILALRRDELLAMCSLLGLQPESEPQVQDMQVSFLGFPCTFDVVCRRGGGVTASPQELLERGLPATALEAMDGQASPGLRLRAQLAAGDDIEGDPALESVQEPSRAVLLGMARDAVGRREQALAAYARAPNEPEVSALRALALLELGRPREALELVDELRGSDHLTTFTLRTAAALRAEGLDAAREVATEWITELADSGRADPSEARDLLASLAA